MAISPDRQSWALGRLMVLHISESQGTKRRSALYGSVRQCLESGNFVSSVLASAELIRTAWIAVRVTA